MSASLRRSQRLRDLRQITYRDYLRSYRQTFVDRLAARIAHGDGITYFGLGEPTDDDGDPSRERHPRPGCNFVVKPDPPTPPRAPRVRAPKVWTRPKGRPKVKEPVVRALVATFDRPFTLAEIAARVPISGAYIQTVLRQLIAEGRLTSVVDRVHGRMGRTFIVYIPITDTP
jgi:hypothetical protein